ncbi:MAG: sulfatase [Agriterribacter sp.]
MKLNSIFIPGILIVACIHSLSYAQQSKRTHPSKPNIIFILTDDQRWDALGIAGNTIIQTPHIDSLGRKGILFKNAYVTTAICCASRASLLSGQYMSRHKIDNFDKPFSDGAIQQTYPLLLRKAGYTTGFIGKFGVGAKLPDANLFDYWNGSRAFDQQYYLQDGSGNRIHNTDSIAHSVAWFLNQYGKEKPFCLSISFKAPHELDGNPPTYPVQEKFKQWYANDSIPEPLTADPKYWNNFPDFFRTDTNIGRVRWKPLFSTHALYEETVKNYYRLISGVDEVVGNIMSQLKALGIDKNTIIIFMGDNGFCLGEHGLEGKWFGYEECIRVPLIVYDPRNRTNRNGSIVSSIGLNIDIAPTILNYAGIKRPPSMQGENLADIIDKKIVPRKDFFYEHTFLGSPQIPKVEGVVSTKMKYMNYIEHGYEELYDLEKDPHETTNLAKDPEYKKMLLNLRMRYEHLRNIAK